MFQKSFKTLTLIALTWAIIFGFSACPSPTGDSEPVKQWTVTFHNEGDSAKVPINDNTVISSQYTPAFTKDGYVLLGWFTEQNGDTKWDLAKDKVTKDLDLYARWTIKKYTVTFDTGEGSTLTPQSLSHGSTIARPAAMTKTGCIFEGWYDQSDFSGTKWDFAKDKVTKDMTLYAKWKIIPSGQAGVTFNTRGGNEILGVLVDKNSKLTQPQPDPEKAGYTFAGWYKEASGTNPWDFANDTVNADITLYAKWTINQYTVTFDAKGGSAVDSQTLNYGSTITNPAAAKTGHSLEGWYAQSDFSGAKWDFANDTVDANITLYAKWAINQYTVTFDAKGGSAVTSQTLNYGSTITNPASTKAGYILEGWYAQSDFSGAKWDFANDRVDADITLYAQWEVIPPDQVGVSFFTQGGSSIPSLSTAKNTKITKPDPDPVKEGYVFQGWFTESYAQNEWDFDNDTVSEDTTLYAKWEQTPASAIAEVKNSMYVEGNPDLISHYFRLGYLNKPEVSVSWSVNPEDILDISDRSHGSKGRMNCYVQNRPDSNTELRVTGTISKDGQSDIKEFVLTIYGHDNEAVDNAYEDTRVDTILLDGDETDAGLHDHGNGSVTTTWTSSDQNILGNDGRLVNRPAEERDVTLTASISKGEASRTKEFVIRVCPADVTADIEKLFTMLTVPEEPDTWFELPTRINDKSITWTSSDDQILEITDDPWEHQSYDEPDKIAALIKPLLARDQNLTLTATIQEETKTFPLRIKGITEWNDEDRHSEFTETTILAQSYDWYNNYKLSYTIPDETTPHIIRVTAQELGYPVEGNALTDIDTAIGILGEFYIAFIELTATAYQALLPMDEITLEDTNRELISPIKALKNDPWSPAGDEDIFDQLDRDGGLEWDMEYEDFKDLSSSEKTEAIKAGMEESRKRLCMDLDIEESTSWHEILEAVPGYMEDFKEKEIQELSSPRDFQYDFVFKSPGRIDFEPRTMYDSNKSWYIQVGSYEYESDDHSATPNYIRIFPDGNEKAYLEIDGEEYDILFEDEDATSFTYEKDGNTLTGSVTDNNDQSITLSLEGTDYTLQFHGDTHFR